ncbi:MAG: polymerase sigma-70 factor, subfamily [Frankiaceae bacterium]|jgi:RNA polymerase sigma-70 factor (ECF subfamily)|nr:polymerase sigma-70 factor, subfamily [Frankiaceae bacterium]
MTNVSEDYALASLVAQAKSGDRDATEQLVAQLRPRVFRYVLARMLDPHVADDVTQEVTVTMVQSLHRHVDAGRPFAAWVFGIAANKVSESRRATARRREATIDSLPEPAADTRLEPEQALLRLETSVRVAELLECLPAQQAEILRLRVAAGLSAEETADVVGMSPGAVRVAQHRALARLRALATEQAT